MVGRVDPGRRLHGHPLCRAVPHRAACPVRRGARRLQYGNDVVPLLRRLKYAPKFEPAFRQVGPPGSRRQQSA